MYITASYPCLRIRQICTYAQTYTHISVSRKTCPVTFLLFFEATDRIEMTKARSFSVSFFSSLVCVCVCINGNDQGKNLTKNLDCLVKTKIPYRLPERPFSKLEKFEPIFLFWSRIDCYTFPIFLKIFRI